MYCTAREMHLFGVLATPRRFVKITAHRKILFIIFLSITLKICGHYGVQRHDVRKIFLLRFALLASNVKNSLTDAMSFSAKSTSFEPL